MIQRSNKNVENFDRASYAKMAQRDRYIQRFSSLVQITRSSSNEQRFSRIPRKHTLKFTSGNIGKTDVTVTVTTSETGQKWTGLKTHWLVSDINRRHSYYLQEILDIYFRRNLGNIRIRSPVRLWIITSSRRLFRPFLLMKNENATLTIRIESTS